MKFERFTTFKVKHQPVTCRKELEVEGLSRREVLLDGMVQLKKELLETYDTQDVYEVTIRVLSKE